MHPPALRHTGSFGLNQDAVKSTHFQDALSKVLTTWRSPHALADYFVMQQEERKASSSPASPADSSVLTVD